MKKAIPGITILFFACAGFGCGMMTPSVPDTDSTNSSVQKVKGRDSLPHEVRHGKVASYAYIPDTSVRSIILGNPESFQKFYRENGANINDIGNNHSAIAYFNINKKEEVQLLTTKNGKKEAVIYAITVQKYGDAGSPLLAKKPFTTSENNYVTGNGIYIGMSPDYVMAVYSDQALMQSQQGDTLVLQYKPQKKDKQYYKRYDMNSYSATYKFVDNQLRRMEYHVDPKEFEK